MNFHIIEDLFQSLIIFIIVIIMTCKMTTAAEPNKMKEELFAINIHSSKVYSSLTDQNSNANYAVDEDLLFEQPTCFKTNRLQPNEDNYHWLLIDFGNVINNVREIRLAADPTDKLLATKLSNIDIFVVKASNSPNITKLLKLASSQVGRLPWDLVEFQACENTGNVVSGTRVANVKCPKNTHGRWLILRRKDGDMNICLISVYVTNAYQECFDTFVTANELKSLNLSGQAFSFIRHLSKSACRAACTKITSCQAIRYKQIGRSGVCEQIRDVRTIRQQLDEPLLNCESNNNCIVELNHCHLGKHYKLSRHNDSDGSRIEFAGEGFSQLWTIKSGINSTTILNSVHLEGTLNCKSLNCNPVQIYSIDGNNETKLCGEIDWRIVSQLNKYYLFCNSKELIRNPVQLQLNWHSTHGSVLQLNISEIIVRLVDETYLPKSDYKSLINIKTNTNELRHDVTKTNSPTLNEQYGRMNTTTAVNTDIDSENNNIKNATIHHIVWNKIDKSVDQNSQKATTIIPDNVIKATNFDVNDDSELHKLRTIDKPSSTILRPSSLSKPIESRQEQNDDPSQHQNTESKFTLFNKLLGRNQAPMIIYLYKQKLITIHFIIWFIFGFY